MAKSYTSTINIKCWKEHTCVACGAVHSYQFVRKITGQARTAARAQQRAQANVDKALKTQVDMQPCPACGIYQPEMIGQQRVRWHRVTFWVALLAFGTVMILRGTDTLQANTAAWMMAGVGTLAALQLFGKELKNFNANLEANRAVAADRITAGTLQLASGETTEAPAEWVRMPRALAQRVCMPVLVVGVAALALPELARMARGWPLNSAAYPPVVGPGDLTRIYMSNKIQSLNGYWRGTPQVTLKTDGGDDLQVDATTNQNDWDETIHVDSDEEHNSSVPWVEIRLPNDPSLAGKTVEGDVGSDVQYPRKTSDTTYETDDTTMNLAVTLKLAGVGAGAMYDQLWWEGAVAGTVIVLGEGLALIGAAKRLRKKGNPTRILVPAAPGAATPPAAPTAPKTA
jgi:hypothetical protein